ncbi:aminopeptidase N [Microbacterium sp. CFH 31415]|uniref:aminopeptidase N n=1 Tax=Microbacterium sp. CFH 31415 TaxID=2921732 RepID=UPI001F131B1A|nr:aminopeptidase N [Microbacterium sp. CFH 31415]MCH6229632.1 aminopeptidase N [Microbacterium sp. CFH 31415]
MTSANLSRAETATRSAAVSVLTARVELDVTTAPDVDETGFATVSTLEIETDAAAAGSAESDVETWVDFIGESVEAVEVDGVARPVEWDGARVRITGLRGRHIVRVAARAAYSRSGEGMHRFVDPVDGQTYLYTHYEPADARRVMACFEQPDMKARYTFVVTAPAGWTVLSNQAVADRTADRGAQRVEFAETLPISTYITSVAAGPYHRVEGEWRRGDQVVPLGVYCRESLAEHLDADEILEITGQGLDFFADAFRYAYPWGKYDQIFVPEYNIGAMENPGLVTFTEAYVFRGAATVAQHEGRANTILHEMAHMWFGDLVTMRWWDDLWLKESFADYMGAHATAAVTRFPDAWVTFAARRKAWAYLQDQLPTTHPIVADIADLEAAKLNFDGITYAKGASVLKQLVAFVGEEEFFEGARQYFAAHAFGNTTLDDLLRHLAAASGRDVRAWSRAWLETTGMSTLRIERDAESAVLVQSDPRPHRLRVGLFDVRDERLVRTRTIDADIAHERTPLGEIGAADLVLANDGDLTYAKVRLDAVSLDAVEAALSTIDDALARGLVWSALWNATRDGDLPAARYLGIVRRHAGAETNSALRADVLANASFAVGHYVTAERRPQERAAWLETAWQQLAAADAGSDAQLAWARSVGSAARYDDGRVEELRGMLAGTVAVPDGLELDPELRWAWLTALATTGHATVAEADAELRRDPTAKGRTAHLTVLAARPDADVRAAAWHSAWEDTTLTNDHLSATIAGVRAGGRRDLIAAFDEAYFARIRGVWSARSIEIAARLVRGLFPEGESLDLVDAWLARNEDAPAALRRIVTEQRDHLARDLRVRAAQPS